MNEPPEFECGSCELTFVDSWVRDEHEADHEHRKGRLEVKPGRGWAWEFDGELCHWAEPDRNALVEDGKPTPEAVAVAVLIVKRPKRKRPKHRKGGGE